MKAGTNIGKWGDNHYQRWMGALRIVFGIIIIAKGIYFIQHTTNFFTSRDIESIFSSVIAVLHIIIGVFITIGLGTRILSVSIVPVIITSVFFTNPQLNIPIQSFLSVIIIILAIFFTIEGSGRFSVYYYFSKMEEPENLTTSEEVRND